MERLLVLYIAYRSLYYISFMIKTSVKNANKFFLLVCNFLKLYLKPHVPAERIRLPDVLNGPGGLVGHWGILVFEPSINKG